MVSFMIELSEKLPQEVQYIIPKEFYDDKRGFKIPSQDFIQEYCRKELDCATGAHLLEIFMQYVFKFTINQQHVDYNYKVGEQSYYSIDALWLSFMMEKVFFKIWKNDWVDGIFDEVNVKVPVKLCRERNCIIATWNDIASQGKTKESAIKNLKEAVELYYERD
jgi:hypothetical protein